jgi:hypothetical protein
LTIGGRRGEVRRVPDGFVLRWVNPALRERAVQVASFDDLVRARALRLVRSGPIAG